MNQMKELIKQSAKVNRQYFDESLDVYVRQIMRELLDEGIIFVPVGHYTYADVAKHTTLQDKAREFAQAQKKALITQYRNTVKPLNQFLTEADKRELMGELL